MGDIVSSQEPVAPFGEINAYQTFTITVIVLYKYPDLTTHTYHGT